MPERRRKPATKSNELLALLRRQIVRGDYPPGSRLPTRSQLQKKHKVSSITVQRALRQLADERLVVAKTKRGTYVVPNPPHLTQIAMIYCKSNSDPGWSLFDAVLAQQGPGIARGRGQRMDVNTGVFAHPDNESYNLLLTRLQTMALAGAIFVDQAGAFLDTPLIDTPGLPRVVLADVPFHAGIPVVGIDHRSWIDRALDHLASLGRRRIAVVGRMCFSYHNHFLAAVQKRDMHTAPQWIQSPNLEFPAATHHCVCLLMNPSSGERPDGLLIDDDHYVEMATTGLMATQTQVGRDLEVVAHTNFPRMVRTIMPVTRLGFDSRQIITTCLDLLDQQRRGEPTQLINRVPAVFSHELTGWPGADA